MIEEQTYRDEDWYGRELAGDRFADCTFVGVDLTECVTRGASFERCVFTDVRLNASRHEGSAFTGCTFTGVSFFDAEPARLQARRLDPAPLLAEAAARARWHLGLHGAARRGPQRPRRRGRVVRRGRPRRRRPARRRAARRRPLAGQPARRPPRPRRPARHRPARPRPRRPALDRRPRRPRRRRPGSPRPSASPSTPDPRRPPSAPSPCAPLAARHVKSAAAPFLRRARPAKGAAAARGARLARALDVLRCRPRSGTLAGTSIDPGRRTAGGGARLEPRVAGAPFLRRARPSDGAAAHFTWRATGGAGRGRGGAGRGRGTAGRVGRRGRTVARMPTRPSAAPRSLADDLRARDDVQARRAAAPAARPGDPGAVRRDVARRAGGHAGERGAGARRARRVRAAGGRRPRGAARAGDPHAGRQAAGGEAGGVGGGGRRACASLALVWGSPSRLRLVRTVRDALGPYPAGLGPPLADLLVRRDPSRLAVLARDLDLTPTADAADLAGQPGGARDARPAAGRRARGCAHGARPAGVGAAGRQHPAGRPRRRRRLGAHPGRVAARPRAARGGRPRSRRAAPRGRPAPARRPRARAAAARAARARPARPRRAGGRRGVRGVGRRAWCG
nr:pentapeptide repeat-containing protein [Angustibacter aerolatus]